MNTEPSVQNSGSLTLNSDCLPGPGQVTEPVNKIVEEVKNEKVDDADVEQSPSTSNQCARSNVQPQEKEIHSKDNNMPEPKENESDDSNDSTVETRRFTRRFIQNVINTYENDAECAGNSGTTAKKFGIHRKQLEKWLLMHNEEKADVEQAAPLTSETSPEHCTLQNQEKENSPSTSSKCTSQGQGAAKRESRKNRSNSSKRKQTNSSISKFACLDELKVNHNNREKSAPSPTPEADEAYDLSKMSSNAMALSLNLSMNSNTDKNAAARTNSSSHNSQHSSLNNNTIMSQYGLNNNNPYFTNSLLHMFPNANPFNYNFQPNSNGLNLHKSSSSERDRDRDRDRPRDRSDSPADLSTTSGGDSSQRTTPNNMSSGHNNHQAASPMDIVDEVAYLYPNEDFTLLRQALIRNEVTFTKLRRVSPPPDIPTNLTYHGNRTTSPPPPLKSGPSHGPTPAHTHAGLAGLQQGLPADFIRQQSEYLKLLQQSGFNGFTLPFPQTLGSDMPAFSGSTDASKYPPWFHSLATATALSLVGNPLTEQSGSKNGRKKPVNGNSNAAPTFATPKLPSSAPYSSNPNLKPKTVAAALAASRVTPDSRDSPNSSNYSRNSSSAFVDYNSKNKLSPRKRQRNKLTSMASRKSYSADEDFVDPTSMLEVVTTPSSSEYPPNANVNDYVKDTPPPGAPASANPLHFLNQLLLESPGNKNIFPDLSKAKHMDNHAKEKVNGNGMDASDHQHQESQKLTPDLSSSDATKNMVLHAFFHDNEVNGDARALARKFGLSGRVVMKWIKESTSRESRQLAMNGMGNHVSPENTYISPPKVANRINGDGGSPPPPPRPSNGDLNAAMAKYMNNFETASMNNLHCPNNGNSRSPVNGDNITHDNNETDSYFLPNTSAKNLYKSNNLNNAPSSVNKRKNSKPNQICDPREEDSFNDEPVDMMLHNKRPRMSHHVQQDM